MTVTTTDPSPRWFSRPLWTHFVAGASLLVIVTLPLWIAHV